MRADNIQLVPVVLPHHNWPFKFGCMICDSQCYLCPCWDDPVPSTLWTQNR